MTSGYTTAISPRVSPEFWPARSALRSEGAGNAGRPMRPIAARAMSLGRSAHALVRSHRKTPGIPHAMVYGLYVISPVTGLSCHRRLRSCLHRLDTSVGASGPHDFAVRIRAIRQKRIRIHRIPPRGRDDRESPLWWGGTGRACKDDLPDDKSGEFFAPGLDRCNQIVLLQQTSSCAQAAQDGRSQLPGVLDQRTNPAIRPWLGWRRSRLDVPLVLR